MNPWEDPAVVEAAAEALYDTTSTNRIADWEDVNGDETGDEYRATARAVLAAVGPTLCADLVTQPCQMVRQPPYDFDQCLTHDRTLPVGGQCDYAGLSELEYAREQAQLQRGRAVVAEMRLDRATQPVRWADVDKATVTAMESRTDGEHQLLAVRRRGFTHAGRIPAELLSNVEELAWFRDADGWHRVAGDDG